MKHALIAAACLAAVGGAAHAQMRGVDPDLNKDGKVTLDEFRKAEADGMLGRLDANKDGKITADEIQAMAERAKSFGRPQAADRLNAMVARLDTNKDGVITRAEIDAGAVRRFKMADANGDGWLSKDELSAARPSRARAD
ncbi:EF-hand domain-containing protein [Phenylobacterium sp.]|uniref:EF-hand domain-containing protein n=1 Tax=Phenylobacterium sp. TaxID=1871053 RepID=UPI0035B3F9C0